MFEKYREVIGDVCVPLSAGRYTVSVDGTVKDRNGVPLYPTLGAAGQYVLTLDLWDGTRDYPVALIMAIAFKGLAIDPRDWHKVKPFFLDGNIENLHASNIGYRFEGGPLESRRYPGFYHIPMFTGHVINAKGEILSKVSGKVKTWSVAPARESNGRGGYRYVTLKSDVGTRYTTLTRHRAMMLVFTDYSDDVDKLDVNHIDGVPGNDSLSNLEWTTRRENNLHASRCGLKSQSKAVKVRDVFTGEVKLYFSAAECARELGVASTETVRYRLAQGNCEAYDGKQFKWANDDDDWTLPADSPLLYRAKHIHTDNIMHFETAEDMSKSLNISPAELQRYFRRAHKVPINGYHFLKRGSKDVWPEENAEPSITSRIETICTKSAKVRTFDSIRECANYLKTSNRRKIASILDTGRPYKGHFIRKLV